MNTDMARSVAIVTWIALVVIACVALMVGTVMWHWTQNGFAGLGALLAVAALGLRWLYPRGGDQ